MLTQDDYEIRHGSLEYLPVLVNAFRAGEPYDPSSDSVWIALPDLDQNPISGGWKSATWDTVVVDSDTLYYAKILVGPGGDIDLALGDYDILVKISASPETPIIRAGRLTITGND